MRNPWKRGEWNGRYSDNSSEWTPELRKQLNFQRSEDGIFWIPFDDMKQVFDVIDICKIDDNARYSYKKVNE